MGYLVEVVGSLVLPAQDEATAARAAREAMLACDGWLEPADGDLELAELASFAGAQVSRAGDLLTVTPAVDSGSKWSEQSTAFWHALAPFPIGGRVDFEGEDEETWSYVYVHGRLTQVGYNGWDGSGEAAEQEDEPGGLPGPAPRSQPQVADLARGRRYLLFGLVAAVGGVLLLLLGRPTGCCHWPSALWTSLRPSACSADGAATRGCRRPADRMDQPSATSDQRPHRGRLQRSTADPWRCSLSRPPRSPRRAGVRSCRDQRPARRRPAG